MIKKFEKHRPRVEPRGRGMDASLPFCTICSGFRDNAGTQSCGIFPGGIPIAVYPWGCVHAKPCECAGLMGFRPKSGMEEITRRWAELF
jgi:hypothetical protein